VDFDFSDPLVGQTWWEVQEQMLDILKDFKLIELVERKQKEKGVWDFQI